MPFFGQIIKGVTIYARSRATKIGCFIKAPAVRRIGICAKPSVGIAVAMARANAGLELVGGVGLADDCLAIGGKGFAGLEGVNRDGIVENHLGLTLAKGG